MNAESLALSGPHHATASKVAAAVANWHDENHWGAFARCIEQPCAAVTAVADWDDEYFDER